MKILHEAQSLKAQYESGLPPAPVHWYSFVQAPKLGASLHLEATRQRKAYPLVLESYPEQEDAHVVGGMRHGRLAKGPAGPDPHVILTAGHIPLEGMPESSTLFKRQQNTDYFNRLCILELA